jgi:hypothetical protein
MQYAIALNYFKFLKYRTTLPKDERYKVNFEMP